MRRALMVLGIWFSVHVPIAACSFDASEQPFCRVTQVEEALIARGRILEYFEHGLIMQLFTVYQGEESRCVIKVYNRPDFNCTGVLIRYRSEFMGAVGQTILFHAAKVVNPLFDFEEAGEYRNQNHEFVGYGRPFNPVVQSGNFLTGFITENRRAVPVDEIHGVLQECGAKNLWPLPREVCAEDELDHVLYPNPTQDRFAITNGTDDEVDIRVYDISGRLVIEQYASPPGEPISVGHLTNGIYIVHAESTGVKTRHKLILNRFHAR